ncbi:hypothetical protein [Clostridium sp.]|jgi:excinuclease UvrABC nuclease subunit|uniref:hypothetical protein n=1 Tax=Clostridium sp. TaxID=1506 RepID=UPI002590D8A9|nr:hypothetical protein [Clostridium sp.]MDF2503067.1 hypothetical protein [Clostridium sp.]
MENTEFRLNESKFLLEKMKESKSKSPDFDYYLNAYISSSRSVIWIMKNEYSNINGWKKWYECKGLSKEQEILLKGIVEIRNSSIKQKPLKVGTYITINDNEESYDIKELLSDYNGKKMKFKFEIQEEELDHVNIIKDTNHFSISGKLKIASTVEKFKNKDIIDVCMEYDNWLTDIVYECTKIFG